MKNRFCAWLAWGLICGGLTTTSFAGVVVESLDPARNTVIWTLADLRLEPGLVARVLLLELEDARVHALRDGRDEVHGDDLDELAGRRPEHHEPVSDRRRASTLRRAEVERALSEADGELARAAELLGVHRSRLRRWLSRKGIDPLRFASEAPASRESLRE